ncbi:MAG: protein kinase, partial [Candidatus Bathyarchaeia archaeon]
MKANSSVGSFLLGRVVAKGSSSVVYEAIQRDLGNRRVAVKVLREEKSVEPEQRELFRAQAEVMGRLSHPNILPVFEMGREGERPYYA